MPTSKRAEHARRVNAVARAAGASVSLVAGAVLVGFSLGLFGMEAPLLVGVSLVAVLATVIWWNATSQLHVETARQNALDAMRVRDERTRATLDMALDAVISIDEAGRVTYWNKRAETIFGWSRDEVMGKDLASLLMPERYRDAHRRGLEHYLETFEGPILNRRIELTALRRDGTEFPIELAVVAQRQEGRVEFNAFIADISERKRAEAILRITEQHRASLLRLSRRLEQAETFVHVLEAALDEVKIATGYQSVWAYLFSDDGRRASLITIQGQMAEVISAAIPVLDVENDAFLKSIMAASVPVVVEDARLDPRTDKEIVAALLNRTIINVPMALSDRRIGAFGTGTFGDEGVRVPDAGQLDYLTALAASVAVTIERIQLLSDRLRAFDEVRTLNLELEQRVAERTAQLEAANKELEAFSYSVSHDLRAPLRHIEGFSRILEDEHAHALDPTGRRLLTVIRDGARNMERMIEDLLRLARIDRQEVVWQNTDLNLVVHDVVHQLQSELEGRMVEWQVDVLPVVTCDPGLMRLVFVNLLSNSVKYTRKRERAVIRISHHTKDDVPVIAVADNGAGFDQRYSGKLFGVFQRLHRNEEFEGTGVGLATVQRIVAKHGGQVWAEGVVNEGATFSFSLALAAPDRRPAGAPPPEQPASRNSQ